MGIKATAVESGLKRTSGAFFDTLQDFTYCYWFTPVQDATLPSYLPVHAFYDIGGGFLLEFAETDAIIGELAFKFQVAGGSITDGIPLVVGDSYFIAVTYDVSAQELRYYFNRALIAVVPGADFTGIQFDYENFATEEDGNGAAGTGFHSYRQWQACLTADELAIESASSTPVNTTDLFANFPFATITDLSDTEANEDDFSVLGTIANFTGITFVTGIANTSATSAQVIAALNYHAVQNVYSSGPKDVWFTYVAVAGDNILGIWAYGDDQNYKPSIYLYTGLATSPVAYFTATAGIDNTPIQVPVTPGTTYFIKLKYNNGAATTSVLSLQIINSPFVSPPVGSIFVNDDNQSSDYPAAIVSATEDYEVITFVQNIAGGEAGDTFNDGEYLLQNRSSPNFWSLYDIAFQLITDITFAYTSNANPVARTNRATNLVYLGSSGTGATKAKVTTVDVTGALGATIWDLGGVGMTAIAANPSDTILYYAGTLTVSTQVDIWKFDLVNNVSLGLFITGITGHAVRDILVLTNGTIIILYAKPSATKSLVVRTYNSAGVQLTSTAFTTDSNLEDTHIAYDTTETFYWLWDHLVRTGPEWDISRFRKIAVSNGAVSVTRLNVEYEDGVYQDDLTENAYGPIRQFGNSESCPFMIVRAGPTPGTGTLIVQKVVVGGPDGVEFDFTGTGTGITPFTLEDGEQQIFDNLTPGVFGVTETAETDYDTEYDVSNGDLHSAITIGADEVVTVIVTNTFTGTNPLSGIYKIVPNSYKDDDTVYVTLDPEVTEDRAIPRPYFRTALIGK